MANILNEEQVAKDSTKVDKGEVGLYTNEPVTEPNQGSVIHILNPKGGAHYLFTSNTAGALKITMPTITPANGNFSFTVTIWGQSYSTNPTDNAKIFISGRGFNDPKLDTVTTITSDPLYDFPVRFGNDGVNQCIWIGELGYTFSYIAMSITDLVVSRSADPLWYEPFNIQRVQAFDTVTLLVENNFPAGDYNKLKNIPAGVTNGVASDPGANNVATLWQGTQAQYDAIVTPDAATIYFIE